ncbi:hypothetical protein RchiOBHm_Chr6g0253131 [Rosa chinensis]|uniref:Uncharacterized protein n=1 Tax=Rosa chinensis TaxID=74649 RepID=A0A2P6PL86_ROSCH|nr:hypothetical protein RchiOBHm_Chr6g0253131 [Rosa chinensis]
MLGSIGELMLLKLNWLQISPSLPIGLRFCSTFPTSKCYRHIMTTTPVGNNGDSMVWHPKGRGTCYSYCITELLQAKAKVITGIEVKLSIPHVITGLRGSAPPWKMCSTLQNLKEF